jgi:hypothetical protein
VALQHPSRKPNPYQRSQNASAYVLPGLYADIDLASGAHAASALPTNTAQAMGFLHTFPDPPSLVLDTGGGLHAYWLFETPLYLTTEAERIAVEQVLRRFAYTICQAGAARGWTLDDLRDLARVLRPPGTINFKYGRSVHVLTETEARYTLADFDWLTPLPAPSVQQGSGSPIQGQPDLVTILEAYGGRLSEKSAEEWHGAHPVHGSSTGINFDVNRSKGLWHCWRHGTGGDALSLLAVCAGLVACEDLQPGALSGAVFRQVLDVAQSRFGWKPLAPSPGTDPVDSWLGPRSTWHGVPRAQREVQV